LRTFGRQYNPDGTYVWAEVVTDDKGFNDGVYLTALCQELQLQTGESPFYASRGIGASQSVASQIFPDYWVHRIQQNYASQFASLKITAVNQTNRFGTPEPVYNIQVITQSGSVIDVIIPQ